MCRVLRFEEGPHAHVVKNVLIDQAAIERTVRSSAQYINRGTHCCNAPQPQVPPHVLPPIRPPCS